MNSNLHNYAIQRFGIGLLVVAGLFTFADFNVKSASSSLAPSLPPSGRNYQEFGASLLSGSESEKPRLALTGSSRVQMPPVYAADGKAFAFEENMAGTELLPIRTSLPVFKAFDLSADRRILLYSPLNGRIPSGQLLVEDLLSGQRVRVTSRLVLAAATSPADPNLIAFTFASGEGFGLATIRLDTREETIVSRTNIYSESIAWNDAGNRLFYLETGVNENDSLTVIDNPQKGLFEENVFWNSAKAKGESKTPTLKLTSRFYAVEHSESNTTGGRAPAGFPILNVPSAGDSVFGSIKNYGLRGNDHASFSIIAPDGMHEVIGEDLIAEGPVLVRNMREGSIANVDQGRVVKVLSNGVLVAKQDSYGTTVKFADWRGNGRLVAATAVAHNLPTKNSVMTQGGAGYSSPGNCSISAHTGALEYAYDFQTLTVGAHAIASADGLVVYTESSITCNSVQTTCADYVAGGCPGSFLGNMVIIQHADGTFSKYAHLQTNSPQAVVGTTVNQGLYIGRQGHTGSTSGSFNGCGDHLHYQLQSSPDTFGQSIPIDFADVATEPLSCGTAYSSASNETAHSISPTSQSFGVPGGSGTVSVSSNGGVWSAVSNNNWITITSGGSGSGNGSVTFSVSDNSAGGPRMGTMYIGGHVFSVSQNGGGVSNQAPAVNAGTDQTITLPSGATLNGTATDDGLPSPSQLAVSWSKVSGPGGVTFSNPSVLFTTANFSVAGIYVIRLTANDGSLFSSDDLTVIVNTNSGGGQLTGSPVTVPAGVNLSNEGTADWAHWGLDSAAAFNRKSSVSQKISNFTAVGNLTPIRYTNSGNSFSWIAGTPTSSVSNTSTGLYVYDVGNGFKIDLPADTTPQTLKLYIGLWNAGGRLEATMSDGSASPLIDTSLVSTGVLDSTYTIGFRAASAGQTLSVKWVVVSSTHPLGNVTLQAATLVTNSPPINQAPTVNAGSDQSITLPSTAALVGSASDDGLPAPPSLTTTWGVVSGPGTVTFGNANLLNTTASFSVAGTYVLRLTANDGALSTSDDLTVVVNAAGGAGSLAVSSASTPQNVNLSTEGTTDWSHWGLSSVSSFNRKSGAPQQISNFTAVGNGSIQRYANNPNLYSWSGGTPTASATNTATGLYVAGANNGFQVTVPAGLSVQTLKLYVGLWAAGGRLEASLSDGSASVYLDTSAVNSSATLNRVYTLNYRAGSNGQTLTVRWTVNATFNAWSNVTLQAATLVASSAPTPTPIPTPTPTPSPTPTPMPTPTPTPTPSPTPTPIPNQAPSVNAGIDQTVTFPGPANLAGTATDDGLPAPPALATSWSAVSGPGIVTFGNTSSTSTTASFGTAGNYILRLTASDGALTSSDDVSITVNSSGGSGALSANRGVVPANVDLSAEGTGDWAHWGLTSAGSFNHKNGVVQQISNFTSIGNGAVQRYANNPNLFSWTSGTPTASATNAATGLYLPGSGNGFQLTTPADTSLRTLKLYVGVWAAGGKLEATLSDGSAPTFVDTSVVSTNATSNAVYTLNYQAASPGATLTVKWTANTTYNAWSNVTLQAATLAGGGPVAVPSPTPSTGEFQVTASDGFIQFVSHVAADPNGNAIIVWQSFLQDGGGWGIFARQYDSSGIPKGNEFQVNTFTANNQFVPRVATDSAGNFAIVWESQGQDGSGYGVYCRRFTAAGVPLGSEFQVNTAVANNQHDPFIAMSPAGDFVVVWASDLQDQGTIGIYGQRFSASGIPAGGEFQLNTYSPDDQKQPSVSMDSNGNFVAVWESGTQDGSGRGVYARRFNAAGIAQGSEVRVNTFTQGDQSDAWVSMNSLGTFVVVWNSALQDGSGSGVFAQRYDAAGNPQGGEFQANTFTTSDQVFPSVAMDAAGRFVVAWQSQGQDGSGYGVFGKRYAADGSPVGGEFQLNIYVNSDQFNPFLAMLPGGNFMAVWISFGQDGSNEGVFGRRFVF